MPVDFEDREALRGILREKRGRSVEIRTPQRGQKKALMDLVGTNAKHSFDARFRVLKPSLEGDSAGLQDALTLPTAPARIECFDISHIQGTDKVASMVVWEDGRMKKSDYRKFMIRTVIGNDDFASHARSRDAPLRRLREENLPRPGLVLVDGGLGQLHAAAEALEGSVSRTSRWPRSPSGKNGFTFMGRKMSPLCWIVSRRCCTWCKWCGMRPIASR